MAIFLATTDPDAKEDGEQIAVSFQSGAETVTVALSLNQAFQLTHRLQWAGAQAMRERQHRPVPACAQIIPFRRSA